MNASPSKPTVLPPALRAGRRAPASAPGWRLALLGCLLASGTALAAPGERPRPQDFPDYSRYVQALVDYQRALETPPPEKEKSDSGDSQLCKDSRGGSEDDRKKNSCEGKYLTLEKPLEDENTRRRKSAPADEAAAEPPAESLEDTISRNSLNYMPGAGPVGGFPDATPRSLPLQEISAADLSEAGVAGLLGLFQNVRMNNLGSAAAPGGLYGTATGGGSFGGSGGSSIDPDGTLTSAMDNLILQLTTLDLDKLATIITLPNGYAVVDASVRFNGSGLSLALSSESHTSMAIVDRDGVPGRDWSYAGAITTGTLVTYVPYVEADIQSIRTTNNNGGLLQLDAYSPGPIYVDLSAASLGVAAATPDGSWIGESTPIVTFGPRSMLTIAAGTRVSAVISKPDALRSPFVTLNGHIGDLSLSDISLLDKIGGGRLGIGRVAMAKLNLVNTRLYMNNDSVVLDAGTGFKDLTLDVERVYIGSESQGSMVGDFYTRGGQLNRLRLSASPH